MEEMMNDTDLLWRDYRALVPAGEEPTTTKAAFLREEIILLFMALARRVAGKAVQAMPRHVDRDSIESLAYEGLIKAVTKYDNTLSVPFEAFATTTIQRKIIDGVRELDWAPRSLRKKQREIDKAEEVLKQQLDRSPTDAEVAEYLGVDESSISHTRRRAEIAAHVYLEDDPSLDIGTPCEDDETEAAKIIRLSIVSAIRKLPFREQAVIALHYYEEKKLAEIAELLGVSEVKIGALHTGAVMSVWQELAISLDHGQV